MSFRLDWRRLLSEKRHTLSGSDSPARAVAQTERSRFGARSTFERDYDRVVFSASFRRLARKTQVHPFAEVDHVHNRLTHSLEVASVGRSLAYACARLLAEKGEMPEGRQAEDLSNIIQSACLAHDIGNPPFGHAGEYAIREWAREHDEELFGKIPTGALAGLRRDWLGFEGNAQSFRMVSRGDGHGQSYMRFTYASLGALIKYPWDSGDARSAEQHKFNVFSTEKELFGELVEELGLRRPDGLVVRHPLSFLSEVADDICYRIADFEDAVELRILEEAEVRGIFYELLSGEDSAQLAKRPLPGLRAMVIGRLIDEALRVLETDYEAILSGTRPVNRDLKSDFSPEVRSGLTRIKESYPRIFGHRPKVATELGAYNTLGRILNVYTKSVQELCSAGSYQKLRFVQQRCLELAWGVPFVTENEKQSQAWWYARVMDFVAGMTDNYAIQVSREIEGRGL